MALLDVHAFSDALGMQVAFQVLLPQAARREIGVAGGEGRSTYPVLWLLHGLSDDHTIWLRRTSIERYAAEANLAVVMPAAGRSFYQDTATGAGYWSYLSEELPALCRAWFPLSPEREDNFAAGLSMGGYGAIRLALGRPDRYAAAASLSGALDLDGYLREALAGRASLPVPEWHGIVGTDLSVAGGDADLFALADRVARASGARPHLFLTCGTEDVLIDDQRRFAEHLDRVGLAATVEEHPGTHDWAFWDQHIQRVIDWLPLRDRRLA